MIDPREAGPAEAEPATRDRRGLSAISVGVAWQLVKDGARVGSEVALCPACGREVQTLPHDGGRRFRIHTGRYRKWCPGSHRLVTDAAGRPRSFDEVKQLLALHLWAEVGSPLIIAPHWSPPPFYVLEGLAG